MNELFHRYSTGRKKRSMNDVDDGETYVYPFLEDIKNTGYAKLNNPECQKRLFCKMASYGGHSEDANTVQKTFFYAATL